MAYPFLSQILSLRDNIQNPIDLSWVGGFAATGNTYAAGISAGDVLNGDRDAACSPYDGAYQVLLNNVPGGHGVKLTEDIRKALNELVVNANTKIKGALQGNRVVRAPQN